ncbi:MAG: HAD family phosphatase [Kurthia sp.]|nr:HAD family phosphatase [Candidatus Kurthia equi]
MKPIKLVAIDMDGTLLNDEHQLTAKTLDVLKQTIAKGVMIVLATGRGIHNVRLVPEAIALNQPVVAANGADIYYQPTDSGEKSYLHAQSVKQLLSIIEELSIPFWGFTDNGVFENRHLTDDEMARCLKIGVQTQDETLLQQFYAQVKDLENLEITQSAKTNYEINYEGISKAAGIQKLCDYHDISMEEVMCLGDSLNDLKLFQVAGFPVAVANAIDELKEIAKAETLSNNEDGVAVAIERYVLQA